MVENYLIDGDRKTFAIYAKLIYHPDKEVDHLSVYEAAKDLKAQFKDQDIQIILTGVPVLNSNYQLTSFKDLRTKVPLLLLFIMGYLFFSFRTLAGVAIPCLIVGHALASTSLFIPWLHLEINSLTFILPSILIAIGIADSIHVLNNFYLYWDESTTKEEAIKKSLHKNLGPSL